MSKRVRIGVVGLGHLGSQHARVLATSPYAELVGVYDIIEAKAKAVADKWNTQVFPDLGSLISSCEAISCVVPTQEHYKVAKEILTKRRHLFLEKPMAQKCSEAKELVNLANQTNLKLQIGHIERFNPAVLAVRPLINNPKFIECHRLAPYNPRGTDVDVILDLMIHDLDLILSYIQKLPSQIQAVGIPVLTDKVDLANVRLEFSGGEIANLTASRIYIEKMRKIRIFQKDTYISIDYLKRDVEVYMKKEDTILPYFPSVEREKEPLVLELEAFLSAILYDAEILVKGEDGLAALELALKIQKSIASHMQRVTI